MKDPAGKVLIVDDEKSLVETLRVLLTTEGFVVETATSGAEAIEKLETNPDVVLADIRMPRVSGIDVLAATRKKLPDVSVVLMTAQASLQSAIQAVNEGAFHYVQKPFENEQLVNILRRAAERRQLASENQDLKREIRRRDESRAFQPLGKAKSFGEALEIAKTVAATDSTVLIQGESGTGKEVLSRYIHSLSPRADGPFLSINCAALPETLLESELFGHVKGSFTGAVKDKEGLFVAAHGGTFFLDEVAEMTPALQVKLLRVLQEREVIPVGSTAAVKVDVRIIAATNRDLEEEIRRGAFRTDLYYRLNVIAIHLPPLRERRGDILLLAEHFLRSLAEERGVGVKQLSEEAIKALMEYDWPGNVRELENALERAVVMTSGPTVGVESLPRRVVEPAPVPVVSERPPSNPTLEAVERAYIAWVLRAEGGNRSRAAEVLGIDPSTLYRKIARYELEGA